MTKRLLALIVKEVVRQGNARSMVTQLSCQLHSASSGKPFPLSSLRENIRRKMILFFFSFSFINIYREPILLGKTFATDLPRSAKE